MNDPDEPLCECVEPTNLFQWRGDPDWWSCGTCDGRVRLITALEAVELYERKLAYKNRVA